MNDEILVEEDISLLAPDQERLLREQELMHQWMLSHEYQEKLTTRIKVNDACLRNEESRILTYQLCKDDPLFFIENFGWTFDPRPERTQHHYPFILFDYQKEAITWIVNKVRNGGDGLIEKSRDMGATWLFMMSMFYLWRFDDVFSGLIGSYKEALVDDRTESSLFGKLDYQLMNTPKWLLPARFDMKKHRQKLKLINPENYNVISGDTMNPEFSRGSRRNIVFLDEGATWAYFAEAWESAAGTTSCRMTCSTPKGHNAFASLRDSGKVDVLTLHWKLHPLKDEEWYEYQKSRNTDEVIAQELDINYQKSQEGRVYPEWDTIQWGDFPYDDTLPLYVSWDYGFSDDTAMIWWQPQKDGKVRIIDAYSRSKKIIDFFVPFVTGYVQSDKSHQYSKKELCIIEAHKGWRSAIHFGDPAGRFTNQTTNTSVHETLKSYGIHVNFLEDAKDFQSRKTATKLLLRNVVANDIEGVKELSLSMENASYPRTRTGGQQDFKSVKPIHNWTSHYRSAVEYFAVNYEKFGKSRKQVRDKIPQSVRTFGKKRIRTGISGY